MTGKVQCPKQSLPLVTDFEPSLSATEDPSVAANRAVRFDTATTQIRSIPAVVDPRRVWWQQEDLRIAQFATRAMILEYQQRVNGRPLWLVNPKQRQTYESIRNLVRDTKQFLTSGKHSRPDKDDALVLQLEASLDRAAAVRGCEYGFIPKRQVLGRQHVQRICKLQHREKNVLTLADKAAASAERGVLLAQIMARHDAVQAKSCWEEEPET